MCFSVLLLAAAESSTLPDPASAQSVGWMVLTFAAVCVAAKQIFGLYRDFFPVKSPPDHETYATKSELAKLEVEHEEEMKRIEHRFEQWLEQQSQQHQESMNELRGWREDLGKWQMGIENIVGKIDTKAEIALGQRHPRK